MPHLGVSEALPRNNSLNGDYGMFGSFSKYAACAALIAIGSSSAFAKGNSTVFVTLWDKGATAPMANDHGIGMPHMKMESAMGVKLSTATVPAGDIDFQVRNSTKETVHEMLVFPYQEGKAFPYDDKATKIDEGKAGSLGEVAETEAGKSGELKLTLVPGKYALLCNIPGHFANGMWTILTVK
jgi:uncharacterized cupredoxin-like copper-binding protein